MLELDAGLEFNPKDDAEFFSLLPDKPAVCLIELREEKAEPHLIRTANLRSRLQRLLGPADPTSKRLNLRELARQVRYRVTNSAFEQSLTYYRIAKHYFPEALPRSDAAAAFPAAEDQSEKRVPAVLCDAAHPRERARRAHWRHLLRPIPIAPCRAGLADSVLDFFKVRRCQIKIRRDPAFPGCIYSEMKMCLAPCFAGCTKEEYDVEVNRLVEFLETSGDSLRGAYEQERERASEELDFERAAAVHKKLEKLDDALRSGAGNCAAHSGPERGDFAAHGRRANDRNFWRARRQARRAFHTAIRGHR